MTNPIERNREQRHLLKALACEAIALVPIVHSKIEVANILNVSPHFVDSVTEGNIKYVAYKGWVEL
jgi:hypothetical protein